MLVKEFMSSGVISCSEDKTVADAAKLMSEKGISTMPVVDGAGKLVGIVTESDFVGKDANIPHALASIKQLFGENYYFSDIEKIYQNAKDKKLADVMSKKLVTVEPSTTLSELVNLMSSKKLKRIPIIEGDKLVGIVTRKDLLKAFNQLE